MPGTKIVNEYFIIRALQCILNSDRNAKCPKQLPTFYDFKMHIGQQATKFNIQKLRFVATATSRKRYLLCFHSYRSGFPRLQSSGCRVLQWIIPRAQDNRTTVDQVNDIISIGMTGRKTRALSTLCCLIQSLTKVF